MPMPISEVQLAQAEALGINVTSDMTPVSIGWAIVEAKAAKLGLKIPGVYELDGRRLSLKRLQRNGTVQVSVLTAAGRHGHTRYIPINDLEGAVKVA